MTREMGKEPGGHTGHEEAEEPAKDTKKVTKEARSNREITCNPASNPGNGFLKMWAWSTVPDIVERANKVSAEMETLD